MLILTEKLWRLCEIVNSQSSSSDLDRTARALREEFAGYFSFSRIASAEDSPFQKQTFWKILHHRVDEIYFCELSFEQ